MIATAFFTWYDLIFTLAYEEVTIRIHILQMKEKIGSWSNLPSLNGSRGLRTGLCRKINLLLCWQWNEASLATSVPIPVLLIKHHHWVGNCTSYIFVVVVQARTLSITCTCIYTWIPIRASIWHYQKFFSTCPCHNLMSTIQ